MSQEIRDLISDVFDNLAAEAQVPTRLLGGDSAVTAINELRQQLADVSHERDLLRSAQGWISVFDRLPGDVRPVLVFGSTKSSSVLRAIPSWTDGDYWYETESEEYMEIVTHWMPLPAAPSAEVKS